MNVVFLSTWNNIIKNKDIQLNIFFYVIIIMVDDMGKGYRYFYDETQKCAKEKLKGAVIGQIIGKELLYCIIAYCIYGYLVVNYLKYMFFFLFLLVLFIIAAYTTRYATLGLYKNKMIVVKFSRFRKDILKIYEVSISDIKYFDFKNGLLGYKLRASFFSKDGEFVKLKYKFMKKLFSTGAAEYKKNVDLVSRELFKIQKTLDKGDF